MRFSIAVNMERTSTAEHMPDVIAHALDVVCLAEEAGFETAWAAEHHGIEYTVGPNPLLQITHWAEHTSTIRLGTAVVVAPYWHPLRAAGEVALADLYSEGRLEVGFGRGAFQYEFDRMARGLPQGEGGGYLRELVPAVKALWAGDYEHDGEYWKFPRATSVPKPLQQPHPPLWIAARDPETFDFAIREGCDLMTTPLGQPFEEVRLLGEKRRAAMANHPGSNPRWMVLRRTFVYEDEVGLQAFLQAHAANSDRFGALFGQAGEVIDGFPSAIDRQPTSVDDLDIAEIKQGMVLGTPEEVVAQLREFEALGVDSYCYGSNLGLARPVERRSVEIFAEHVMPAFEAGGSVAGA